MLTWWRTLALLQFRSRLLHLNVAHQSKMEPLHRDLLLQHRCQCKWHRQGLRIWSAQFSLRHFFLVCSMRQCMSEVWLGATGLWRANWAERHAKIRAEFKYLLLWKYKRLVLEEAFKRRRLFSVPDNSLPTDRRLIIQQWVIKGSTGRKGLSWQSTLLP